MWLDFVKVPESSISGPRVTNSRLRHCYILPLPKNTVESRKSAKLVGPTARPGYCRILFLRKKVQKAVKIVRALVKLDVPVFACHERRFDRLDAGGRGIRSTSSI
jgi:hypothetical protein